MQHFIDINHKKIYLRVYAPPKLDSYQAHINLKSLLNDLQQNSKFAFNTLYTLYSKELYTKIYRITKAEDIAEEILQDTFIKLWKSRAKIQLDHSFEAYIYIIAKNLLYDYFRKVARDKKLQQTILLNAVDYYMQVEESIIGKETANLIQEAINDLSESRKRVFILCKMEGKSYLEAAEILGISLATVNSHMVTSLKHIKNYLRKANGFQITTLMLTILDDILH